VVSDCHQSSNDRGRVIKFRPRRGLSRASRWGKVSSGQSGPYFSPVADLTRYENPTIDDEYRQRMMINVIVMVFIIVLIVTGVWLTNMLASSRNAGMRLSQYMIKYDHPTRQPPS